MFLDILITIAIMTTLCCAANIIRLKYFSNYVSDLVDSIYSHNMAALDVDIKSELYLYPDIDKTFKEFKWYEPFNYNFEKMIIY